MDPHGSTAQRFPLVARFRPACLPLPQRVHALSDLAAAAVEKNDQGLASSVYNQAALLASDLALPSPARDMCRQHAAAYLHACPLPAMSAIRGLEPVVNLARLQIRAGHADRGRRSLLDLYGAVEAGAEARIEGVLIPADLTSTGEARDEVRTWLWRVLLADGTRALTTAGCWAEALAHVEAHRGLGQRMFDGRQVAVLAALVRGDTTSAADLLAGTRAGDAWEQAVTDCLVALCRRDSGDSVCRHVEALTATYLERESAPGMTVFDIRLGLSLLDAVDPVGSSLAPRIAQDLYRRTMTAEDGYAARELLMHPRLRALTTDVQKRRCRTLLRTCALGSGALPPSTRDDLAHALQTSDSVIRNSLT